MKHGTLRSLVADTKKQHASKPAKGQARRGKDALEFVGNTAPGDVPPRHKATYYMDDRQIRALKALAAHKGYAVSELMRHIVDRFLGEG